MRRDLWEARARLLQQVDAPDLSSQQVAERLGWCVETVRRYRKMLGITGIPNRPKREPTERENAMAAMYRGGKTLQDIGDLYGVSRERVRQILSSRFGITSDNGGQRAATRAKRKVQKSKKDGACFEKHGCSHADYKKLVRIGREFMKSGGSRYRTPIGAFIGQRSNAAHRGIEWNIKLWDWWNIWQESGKWEQRGREKGQYVMCRFQDSGAYEVGNVYIATNSHNCSLQPNNPYRSDHPDHEDVVKEARANRIWASRRSACKRKYHGLPIGVTMSNGRYMAQISLNGKGRYIGSFGCPKKAGEAYQKVLREHLGEALQ